MVEPELLDALVKIYATHYSLKGLAEGAHRNIRGDLFASLHEMFGAMYDQIEEPIDEIGEQARFLGVSDLPYALDDLAALADPGIPKPKPSETDHRGWTMALLSGHMVLCKLMTEYVAAIADDIDLEGIRQMIGSILQACQRRIYKLKSQLGM